MTPGKETVMSTTDEREAQADALAPPHAVEAPAPAVATPEPQPQRDDAGDEDESEADADAGATVLLVNSAPEPPVVRGPAAAAAEQRAAVVPQWVRTRSELEARARWAVLFYGHICAFHAVRVPLYAARLALRAPTGLALAAGHTARWLRDAEGHPARQAALVAADTKEYLRLSAQRDSRVQSRWLIVLFAAPAALWVSAAAPAARWALILLALGLLGRVGSPADRPLVGRAVTITRAPRLTDDMVVAALGALTIGELNKALAKGQDREWFPAPIARDGEGWRAEINLPLGVTAAEVIDRRAKLASGLRRPLGCVWPEPVSDEHEGRLVLWVGDTDLSKAKPAAWPLARSGVTDLFKPVPFGLDQRGRPVTITLMFASMVVGAIPRMGKTFALRLLILAAALDVRAALYLFDLKGTGDFGAAQPVAHRYRSGDEDDDLAYAAVVMRELAAELRRRTRVIRELPRHLVPESKVTPELASRKGLGLHPILLVVDECQRWFEHPTLGDELTEIAADLVRRGPAVGIIAVFATQRPDAGSLPTGISANAVLRFCLKVMGQTENDMVLGTSSYKNGVRATLFRRRDKGIGILAGEADDPQVTRTYFVDNPAAEQVIGRARQLREAAGTLTGYALGEEPKADPAAGHYQLLDDVLAVVPAGEAKVWSEVVVDRLAEFRPKVYAGWGPDQLAVALKPYGIATAQIGRRVDGQVVNRRGIDRAHIAAAITAGNTKADPD